MKLTSTIVLWLAIIIIGCTPLPEEHESTKLYSVADALGIIAAENDAARALYTKAIVGAGLQRGLKFDEHWDGRNIEAGPLPALFLRGIAADIQRREEVPLGLFLGSDFPIRSSNRFNGKQAELFAEMKKDLKPKYFFDESNQLYTAMFPDFAVTGTCVDCHNNHPETTKSDWQRGELMGATTWSYPQDSLSFEELQALILAYRRGVATTYELYLDEVRFFKEEDVPEIGNKWPSQGYYLPTRETFIDSVLHFVAPRTLNGILRQ